MAAGGQKGIKAGRAYVEVGVHDKLVAGLKRAQRRLKAFGAGVQQIGARLARFGAVAGAALFASAKMFARMGDDLAKMSQRTGMSVEALSQLRYVASQTGTSMSALENGLRRMQRTLYDADRGLSTAVDGLADLGLSVEHLRGLAPEAQFKLMAEAISRIEDPSRKAALAMVLFGRSGTALLPMFADGAAGIERLMKKADDLGLTITKEAAEAAVKFTDDLDTLWQVVKIGIFHIGASLVPLLTDLAKTIQRNVAHVTAWVRGNKELIVSVAKTAIKLAIAGVALVAIGKILAIVATIFSAGVTAVRGFVAVLSLLAAHPVILVLMAIAAAVAGIIYLIQRIRRGRIKKDVSAKQAAAEARKAAAQLDKVAAKGRKELEAVKAMNKAREDAHLEQALKLEEKLAAIRKRQADRALSQGQRRIRTIRQELAEQQKLIDQLLELEQRRKGGPRAGQVAELRKKRGAAEKHALEEIMRIQNAEEERRARETYRRLEQLHRDLVNVKMESAGVGRRTAGWAVDYEQWLKKRKKIEAKWSKEVAEQRMPMRDFAQYVKEASEGLYMVARGKVLEKITGARGAFSAAAIARALGGGTAAEVTARNTDAVKKNTQRLVKLAEKGKLVFTP